MSEEPQSAGSDPVTSVVGRLLQHIVALLEARVDLTRQEMRAALRDVAISLFLLVSAADMGHPDAVETPDCRRVGVAGGAPAGVPHLGDRRARRAAGGSLVCAAPAAQGGISKGV